MQLRDVGQVLAQAVLDLSPDSAIAPPAPFVLIYPRMKQKRLNEVILVVNAGAKARFANSIGRGQRDMQSLGSAGCKQAQMMGVVFDFKIVTKQFDAQEQAFIRDRWQIRIDRAWGDDDALLKQGTDVQL